MPAEPEPNHSYPAPSSDSQPFILQDDQTAPVSQAGNDVSQTVKQATDRVSQLVTQPGDVSQNDSKGQQKPCDTSCITNVSQPKPKRPVSQTRGITGRGTTSLSPSDQPRFKHPKFHHYPLADRMQIRKDWIKGLGTLSSLSRDYQIPLATVRTWHDADSWKEGRARWRAAQMKDDFDSQPIAPKPLPPPPATPLSPFLDRITKQIECLDNLLDNAKTPEDWQKLTNSKDKLLQNFYVLAGIAKPAARKASKVAPQRVTPIEPVEPTSNPVEPANPG